MNKPILNRDFKLPADDWYEIEVPGTHFNPGARVVQIIDDKAVDSIVNRFTKMAEESDFAGLLIDRDHFSLDVTKSSKAAGWVTALRNRDGRIEAQIRWSKSGREDVEGGDYRFFSTVYDQAHVEEVGTRKVANRQRPVRAVRPLQLDRLAITNDPNNKGGKPISNRKGEPGADNNQTKSNMNKVNKLLDLAEDASEDAAVAEINKIKNRATDAEKQVTDLTAERDGLLASQVEADLEKYKDVITNKDAAKKSLIANRSSAIEFFDGLLEASQKAEGKDENDNPITNRKGARQPGGANETEEEKAQKAEEARAAKISNRARQLRAEDKGLSTSRSYELAEEEIDEAAE